MIKHVKHQGKTIKFGRKRPSHGVAKRIHPFSKYMNPDATTTNSYIEANTNSNVGIHLNQQNRFVIKLDGVRQIALPSSTTISVDYDANNKILINWGNSPVPNTVPNTTPTPSNNVINIPPSVDYSLKATQALGQMYMNDTLGCCVISDIAHEIGVFTGNDGNADEILFSNDQIVTLYSAIGGYVPGDPSTDNGCDEVTAWDYWKNKGAPLGQNQIAGYVSIDGANTEQIMQAIYLFENVAFGVELPDAWISPFPSANGFTWDVAGRADPNNGHAFPGVGYNANGVQICTWGMIGTVTWDAIRQYTANQNGGALYCMISNEILNKQSQTMNGFDWAQLQADFATL